MQGQMSWVQAEGACPTALPEDGSELTNTLYRWVGWWGKGQAGWARKQQQFTGARRTPPLPSRAQPATGGGSLECNPAGPSPALPWPDPLLPFFPCARAACRWMLRLSAARQRRTGGGWGAAWSRCRRMAAQA